MKIYYESNNAYNMVIATDGNVAKIYNGVSTDGKFEGIDLYDEGVVDLLKEHFRNPDMLDNFSDWRGDDEMDYDDIAEELESDAILICEC